VNDRNVHFRSPLFDELAQLLVLYEHIRVEAFAATTHAEESTPFGAPGGSGGTQDSFCRCMAAQSEFAEALQKLSQTDEYKMAERKLDADFEMKNLFVMVSRAARHFQARQALVQYAEVCGVGCGATNEAAAPPPEKAMSIIRDGFTHATEAMNALVAAFICDRF
jgi:hypothetical protein